MKRILIYLIFAHLLVSFSACEKDIMGYEGKEGVYFAVRHGSQFVTNRWPYQPFSVVEFSQLTKDEVDVPLTVSITGPVKDYDRTFRVEINPDSTTAILGEHYTIPNENWTIPAGAISTNVILKVKRRPDLLDQIKTVGLRLVATQHFSLSFPEWDAIPEYTSGTVVPKFDASLHTVRLSDMMVTPAVWSGSIQPGNKESGLFGIFSRKKMEFLTQYLGLKYEDFSSPANMPMIRMLVIASDATAILVRLKDAGTPVLDSDGRLMWMGSVPWTSIIGVPYAP